MIATQPSPSYPFGFFLPPNTPNKPMNAALMFRSINPKTFKNEKNVLLVFFLVHMKKKETRDTPLIFALPPRNFNMRARHRSAGKNWSEKMTGKGTWRERKQNGNTKQNPQPL